LGRRGAKRILSLWTRTLGSNGGAVMSNLVIAMRWLHAIPVSTQVPDVGRLATEYTVKTLPSAVNEVDV
jgi:hypothetical protein